MRLLKISLYFLLLSFSTLSHAGTAEQQEKDFLDLSKSIKCITCNGQSIFDSNAKMASAMKDYIWQQLQNDKTPSQIKAGLAEQYGQSILLEPQFKSETYLLWFLPFFFITAGILVLFRLSRLRKLPL